MNAVDTGWVTDMAPGGLGAAARAHETFVGPPLDDEVRGVLRSAVCVYCSRVCDGRARLVCRTARRACSTPSSGT